jgi:hypothetical protein
MIPEECKQLAEVDSAISVVSKHSGWLCRTAQVEAQSHRATLVDLAALDRDLQAAA